MCRWVSLENQARQSKSPVKTEISKADTARGGERLVVPKRPSNLCASRRRGNVVSSQPHNLTGVPERRVARIRVREESRAERIHVDCWSSLRCCIVVHLDIHGSHTLNAAATTDGARWPQSPLTQPGAQAH